MITEMSSEEFCEYMQEQEKTVQDCLGMISLDHYEIFKYNTIMGLIMFGGNFAKALGELLARADMSNSVKILRVWQNECVQHEMLFRIHQAKEKAKTIE